ncbi:MAG: 4-(cytidine 5'-diphospho)-2-C-methyl-D-erythritol kinase [Zetaproteobacteria bacterium CG12_big_fil_rev_8_21_14_0_65_54_13]|nr:MAG: 4-(cytidine 5'-diphospho)-2-C-methyl-D-erythritol kinase [Zetaproteobacteria bacterium CG23_combo_of_CG06-09_8_20_14_all_54_7]PIW44342.1 MAG: 4-(cytidine 5'-diphospho)-2-C-methyl-D-erythritol kinase [Zetaproteobacteria bacterium CG12_big_fil_rev_8_21_14_0_65_54_13]PIX55070.1 MAG: 4-(cytidine 5'-diphospho)-2-C-methyl-D-erythritol kinase [Zetaproteobacteria bacterium CG_4_10_14_3_um_filter_54_28]PJA30212.1 MAG: 4-(cytidine 5'-diphospho)-2-C-methyl-D-erythritol kinase [Zetaproteobacteria ba
MIELTLPAPAKINLYLSITRIRSDGMHELDTAFAFSEASDQLHFTSGEQISVSCSRPHLGGEANLVHRVLTAFKLRHGIKQGLAVHIDKQIPEQAGLGGGSSDAATALMAANKLWDINISRDEMIGFATPFGADIPCFLYGKASIARGIGERLCDYPLPLPDQTMLLAWPGSGLSTAAVFKHFDSVHPALTGPEGVDTIRRGIDDLGHNDLEASACSMSQPLAHLLAQMRQHSDQAWMSGSGSACIGLFRNPQQAADIAQTLQTQHLASWTHTGSICSRHPVQLLT